MSRISIIIGVLSLLIGPFLVSLATIMSKKIEIRDKKDYEEALKKGEEPMELPEGLHILDNQIMAKIIISIILSAVMLALSYFVGANTKFLLYGLTTIVLVFISVIDFQVYEIPIECNIVILLLGIVNLVLNIDKWYEYAIGFCVVSGMFLIASLITKGKGMGGGDIKLMATLGLLLGWKQILLVMVLGCILGIVCHGIRMLVSKKNGLLAFGPYLSLAAFICMCKGEDIINWYLNLMIK